MAKNKATTQSEMELDDFQLESPKALAPIKAEDLQKRVGEKQSDGKVKTFTNIENTVLNNLDNQVEEIMQKLLSAQLHSQEIKDITVSLNNMGNAEIEKTSNISNRMLSRPLKAMLQNDFSDGKSIASSLKKLRSTVTSLDPSRKEKLFSKNKILGIKIPFGIGNRVDSYMQEFRSSQSQIDDIVQALLNGKDELIEDNSHIDEEREQMAQLMHYLEQYAYVMKQLDKKIEDKLPEIEIEDKLRASDIKQEILFPIRQKGMDIYQHLAVCMQGYMSLQVVKKNNAELIRGVERATKTTVSALRTAVLVSESLGTQKLVLDQISAVNDVTNNIIARNAEMLQDQGVQIQKEATKASISIEVLSKSFEQIFAAMDAIDNYRNESLPNMKKTVDSLEKTVANAKNYLSNKREKSIGNFMQEVSEPTTTEDKKTVKVMR